MSLATVQNWLPSPLWLKEATKKVAGTAAFISGVVVLTSQLSGESVQAAPGATTLERMLVTAAKISIVCTALSTPWAAWIASSVAALLPVSWGAATWLGAYAPFAVNPLHLRHVLSITGALLGLPAVVQVVWSLAQGKRAVPLDDAQFQRRRLLFRMAAFNTVFSRPALHIGNALVHCVLG